MKGWDGMGWEVRDAIYHALALALPRLLAQLGQYLVPVLNALTSPRPGPSFPMAAAALFTCSSQPPGQYLRQGFHLCPISSIRYEPQDKNRGVERGVVSCSNDQE